MEHDETRCQPAPEGPILCVNNCGFFGSAANMNMCSKCYKDVALKQEQAKFAASSIENIVNESSSSVIEKVSTLADVATVKTDAFQVKAISVEPSSTSVEPNESAPKKGPSRCTSCNKRVGLTGFTCRCGNLYCGTHRYSDKHECAFDYRGAGQDAIAKANPVVKANKLDRI